MMRFIRAAAQAGGHCPIRDGVRRRVAGPLRQQVGVGDHGRDRRDRPLRSPRTCAAGGTATRMRCTVPGLMSASSLSPSGRGPWPGRSPWSPRSPAWWPRSGPETLGTACRLAPS